MSKSQNFQSFHRFSQLPDFLFEEEPYASLTNDAKILYALLLRRRSLSQKNNERNGGWKDQNGLFVLFTRQEMMRVLHCSENKVRRLLKELREVALLEEKRQGLNRPNLIYIYEAPQKTAIQEPVDLEGPEPPKCTPIEKENTINIQLQSSSSIELIKREKSIKRKEKKTDDEKKQSVGEVFDMQAQKNRVNAVNKMRLAKHVNEKERDWKQVITSVLQDAKQKKITRTKIAGQYRSSEEIINRLNGINADTIAYVLDCLSWVDQPIRYPRAYILTALFQAPENAAFYKRQLAKPGMRKPGPENWSFGQGSLLAALDELA